MKLNYFAQETADPDDFMLEMARAQGYVALDTETDCIDCIIARLAGVSLAFGPK